MIDKSDLLKQMRKHAKTFSSAIGPQKAVDQKNINKALALIDLFAKESNFGYSKKLSIKIPSFLNELRIKDNLYFLEDKKDPFNNTRNSKKDKDKFKKAEKKLLKILSTKSC